MSPTGPHHISERCGESCHSYLNKSVGKVNTHTDCGDYLIEPLLAKVNASMKKCGVVISANRETM